MRPSNRALVRLALVTVVLTLVPMVALMIAVARPLDVGHPDSVVAMPDNSARGAIAAAASAEVVVSEIPQALGRPIAPGFIGLSLEFPAVRTYTGAAPRAVNPVLEELIRNIAPGQSPVLRIGGDSTDSTWWPTDAGRRPLGVRYALTRGWLATTRAFVRELHARVIVGVNLEAKRPALTIAETRALVAGLGRRALQAVEIGNEPDNYSRLAWYRIGHRRVFARQRGYGFQDFVGEFASLRTRLSGIGLAGPTVGGYGWLSHLETFLKADPRLAVVTFHRYPLNRCFTTPGSLTYPTVRNLLGPAASTGLVADVPPYAALAHRRGVPFRVDEMNSVACGGKHGVSDTFASTLWVLDTLFEMVRAGVDGVNIHTFPGAAYELFTFKRTSGRWSAMVRPEYYGLLMFARAAPPGARLLKLTGVPTGRLKAWATRSLDGTVHVVLINKSLVRRVTVTVRLQGDRGRAILERLTAPRAGASSGIALAGQSFATPSYSGTLIGRDQANVVSLASGKYRVTLAPTSAALLTIPARRSCCAHGARSDNSPPRSAFAPAAGER